MEPSNKTTKPSITVCRGQLGFTVSELGFALWKLGSTLSRLDTALLKPGFEEMRCAPHCGGWAPTLLKPGSTSSGPGFAILKPGFCFVHFARLKGIDWALHY